MADRPLCRCGRARVPFNKFVNGAWTFKDYCVECSKDKKQSFLQPGVDDLDAKLRSLDTVAALLEKVGYTPGPLLEIKHDLRRLDHLLQGMRR